VFLDARDKYRNGMNFFFFFGRDGDRDNFRICVFKTGDPIVST
jgi:hypothetical protein